MTGTETPSIEDCRLPPATYKLEDCKDGPLQAGGPLYMPGLVCAGFSPSPAEGGLIPPPGSIQTGTGDAPGLSAVWHFLYFLTMKGRYLCLTTANLTRPCSRTIPPYSSAARGTRNSLRGSMTRNRPAYRMPMQRTPPMQRQQRTRKPRKAAQAIRRRTPVHRRAQRRKLPPQSSPAHRRS